MVAHFASVTAALFITLWSTVLTQYHEFRGTPLPEPAPVAEEVVQESPAPGASPATTTLAVPSPLDTLLPDIFGPTLPFPTSSVATTVPVPLPQVPKGPVTPTTPSVPFTPLPVPPPPVITPPTVTVPTPTPVVSPTPAPELRLSDEALLRGAIVNIICLPGGGLRGSSGSGVVVDPRGIILTVAHVGQNFLLRDYPKEDAGECYIRTGSPAKNAYRAEPIYISPDWIRENEATFLTSRPVGTGEDDFAFLAITGSMTSSALPASFSYIPLANADTDIDEGDEVGTGSYAAEFLSSSEVRSSLYPTIKFAEVQDVYTFGRTTKDIFSVAAGSAAQEGSSGGAVINSDDRLIGLITTRTVKPDLSSRTLQALTMDHIRRSFRADTGENLDAYLRQSISTLVSNFEDDADELLEIMREDIDRARN